jgi:hypothetical protein
MPVPDLPTDRVNSSLEQEADRVARASAAQVLAWVRGHGPVPAPHSVARLAHDAIQSLRTERELALADRRSRTPADKTPAMPSSILAALLDPALVDLRHHDVVRLACTPAQYFVAFDPDADALVSWEAGDPSRVRRWTPSSCRADMQLAGLIRAGRSARYPWPYPDVPMYAGAGGDDRRTIAD